MTQVIQAIVDALDATWHDIAKELRRTSVSHWNESVFRYLFVRAFLRRNPEAVCYVEWNRIDLVVQCFGKNALVEFKFFHAEIVYNLNGKRLRPKGGAGKKNFREFCKCMAKLATIKNARWRKRQRERIDAKLLILAYVDRDNQQGKKSFRHWYANILPRELPRKDSFKTVRTFEPIVCKKSNSEMNCKLFAVV